MEMKLGQSFQLSEVRNKSEPLQKHIHTMQINLWFIVTFVEGYIPVVMGSNAIMREWKTNNRDTIENRKKMFADISWMKNIDIAQALYRIICVNTTQMTTLTELTI